MKAHECAPLCPEHNRPLICPSCVGATGGRKTSPAKKKSSAKNAKRARRALAKKLAKE